MQQFFRFEFKWFLQFGLDGAVYFTGSETTRANLGSSNFTVFFDSDVLNIRIPLSSRMSVGMRNVISGNLSFTANLALS